MDKNLDTVVVTYEPSAAKVTATGAALTQIRKLIEKQGHGQGLRVGIKKSGCSGYAYVTDIVDAPAPDDEVFTIDGLLVVVARQHLLELNGIEIDYVKDGLNRRFQFNNPNQTGSCGCGESFTTKS